MTKEEFLRDIETTYANGIETIKRKNADYAGDSDPFTNFELFAFVFRNVAIEKCDKTELAIMMRILDKIQRIANLMPHDRENQVKDEALEDTLVDVINYEAIFKAYRKK